MVLTFCGSDFVCSCYKLLLLFALCKTKKLLQKHSQILMLHYYYYYYYYNYNCCT